MVKVRYRSRANRIYGEEIAKKTEKRSKKGCLTCRQRRKKCDEVKPRCTGCARNFLACRWPVESGVERTSDDGESLGANDLTFVRVFDDEIQMSKRSVTMMDTSTSQCESICGKLKDSAQFVEPETKEHNPEPIKEPLDLQIEPYRFLEGGLLADITFTRRDTPDVPTTQEQSALDPKEVFRSNYSFLDDVKNSATLRYQGIIEKLESGGALDSSMDQNDEAFLFYVCIRKFIPKLGPQDTHPLLTTCATFIPQVENNAIMKEVFLCCGATYLEWFDRPRYSTLSKELYDNCQMLIDKYLSENALRGVELWLLASFQLMCLRNKSTFLGCVDECVKCLSRSYVIIKNTYFESQKRRSSAAIMFQNLVYTIENEFMGDPAQDRLKRELVLQPHERMYIESFIYNYSVAILFATDVSRLPSPFDIFKELSHVLKCPLYHCEFEWMNNPVLGSALDAFEILAKASYIARMPMPLQPGSVWMQRARQLRTTCLFYTNPVLPPQAARSSAQKLETAKLNSLVAKIVTKSTYLLVSKVIDYEKLEARDPAVHDTLREILAAFAQIPLTSSIWGILPWSLVVAGCFATTIADRAAVLRYTVNFGESFHNQSFIKMRRFLERVWGDEEQNCLQLLFDRRELSQVVP
ncbi:LAMI_0G00694g1_1 [Lachancea mirantina]|uniref:LAMI_0G00694g1_1 n=1 Tax=Lachancea mirantina TaxID=1230905 RepID=A0A1G4K765_9SACH|nr:LAMI_0G00694g1_1 [Lachancea mirantina]